MDGERPDRPNEPDLTDSVWTMTLGCWLQDPVQRPVMTKVVAVLREWPVPFVFLPKITIITPFHFPQLQATHHEATPACLNCTATRRR